MILTSVTRNLLFFCLVVTLIGCEDPYAQSEEVTSKKEVTSMVNSETLKSHLPRSEQRNLPRLSFNTPVNQKHQQLLREIISKNSNKIAECFSIRGENGSNLHLTATSFTIVIKEKRLNETASFDTKDTSFISCLSGIMHGADLVDWDLGNQSIKVTLDPNNSVVR